MDLRIKIVQEIYSPTLNNLNHQTDLISRINKKKTKVIYFSTIHVYENFKVHKSKTYDLLNSRSDYAIRNIVCENLLLNKLKNQKC